MKREKGFGIVAAIFVILILSMLTIFSVSLFSSDIQIALDSMRSAQTLFLCEGAMNYCIKHELIDDTDWSDNTDTIDKPLGRGIISIYYDPNRTRTKAFVRVVATVDNVTRQITRGFDRGWPQKYADFPYSLFTTDKLMIKKSPNLSIEVPYETKNTNSPNINCNWGYYSSIADTTMPSNWNLSGSSNLTFTGITYVNGKVEFKNCNNLTINGTIVAINDIIFSGCTGITITPSGNNPALVCGSVLKIQQEGSTKSQNIDMRGMVFSQVDILIKDVRDFSMTGILYARQHIDVLDTDDFRIDGSIISHTEINFDDCGGTGPDINWGNKVLIKSPGFTWSGGSFVVGTWEEVY